MATLGIFKIKVFRNQRRHQQILSCDSNYTVDVVLWPKFGKSSISMREVIITSILLRFDQENPFFEGQSWFKFNTIIWDWH